MAEPDIPTLALPVRIQDGAFVVNDQDTIDDIATCVESVVRYENGYLPFLPEFGRPEVVFRQATEPVGELIRSALAEWEPRALTVLSDEQLDDLTREIRLTIDRAEDPSRG